MNAKMSGSTFIFRILSDVFDLLTLAHCTLTVYLQIKSPPSVDYRYKLLYNYGNLGKDVFFIKREHFRRRYV